MLTALPGRKVNSDAFTHGPTGPGPRGLLKILKLGGPEQKFEKPMNFANLEKESFFGLYQDVYILVSLYSIFRVLPYQTISLILTCLVTECPP